MQDNYEEIKDILPRIEIKYESNQATLNGYYYENKNIYKCSTIEEAVDKSDIIIGSIPFMKNNSEVYAIFSDKNIRLDELVKKDNKSKIYQRV